MGAIIIAVSLKVTFLYVRISFSYTSFVKFRLFSEMNQDQAQGVMQNTNHTHN
jgi:hypothetical protein